MKAKVKVFLKNEITLRTQFQIECGGLVQEVAKLFTAFSTSMRKKQKYGYIDYIEVS